MSDDRFAKDFMRDVPRGDSTRFLRQQAIPQARWMRFDEIVGNAALTYDPRHPGDKVLIGALGKQLIGVSDDRHILTKAGSRSGKSVGLISNLFFYRGSVLATDPKAELTRVTAAAREALGQRVLVLDPFGVARGLPKKWRASYNPMDVLTLDSPTLLEDAALIAEAVVVQSPDQKDPHWDESARQFIEGLIVHVASAEIHAGRRNLLTVRSLLKKALSIDRDADDETRSPRPALFHELMRNAEILARTPALDDLAEAVSGAALGFYEKGDNERAGVYSSAYRHTQFLDYSAFRRVLKSSDFRLEDLKADPRGLSLYLCFPATRGDLSKRWMRIFINQMLDAMEHEETRPAVPVLVCLDEFPVLGYMKQLETAAGLIASFGVKLWVVLQDWNQGKALYGDRWETFVGNAGILQFFGNTDVTTTEYISKLLGKTPVEVARVGEVGGKERADGRVGRSDSVELHDLLTPDEVRRQFARDDRLKRQLVILAGHHPMILQRVEYFDRHGPLTPYL